MLAQQFPEKRGVDYSKIQITPEGEYSMTKRNDGQKILQKIVGLVGDTKTLHLTDLTGNVGADTILFGLNFKTVDSIEYEQSNFDALKNNVQVFKLKNVFLHFGDSTKLYNWHTDVLYLDPPWGGTDYKSKQNIDLYLGTRRVDLFLKKILKQPWKPSYIFLKLPRNYNFERLETLPVLQGHKFAIRGYFLVGLVTQ